jgi:multidrug efflux pump subunit AcrA (membrane-fusion protein)
MKLRLLICAFLFLQSCKSKIEKTKPVRETITESVYASGVVKSRNQYQAFASVNGIIDTLYVMEGDTIKIGSPILSVSGHTQRLNMENAELAAGFADAEANQGKVNAAKLMMELAFNKLKIDSSMFARQSALWQQKIGTQVEWEQRQLAYQNSKSAYYSAVVNYKDIKRQVDFTSAQAKKLLSISMSNMGEYVLRSEIDGVVYSLEKSKGEIVTAQTPVAVIGDARHFILDMQVDEFDILKIRIGQIVIVTMDSYKGETFEARITKINPLMNERSKTFTVEAMFNDRQPLLYPNISFEASIIVQTKSNALLIPRSYLVNDSTVLTDKNKKLTIKTGLMDYQKVEVLSGLSVNDELIKPAE